MLKNLKRYCGIAWLKKMYSRSKFYDIDICAFYAFDKQATDMYYGQYLALAVFLLNVIYYNFRT